MRTVEFTKGHATKNDFIILEDLDNHLRLTDQQIRKLCDRRSGIGADGILRVAASTDPRADWFMDYRNADASLAEMCGNGLRLFIRYLYDSGLDRKDTIAVMTRAGLRYGSVLNDRVRVSMGRVRLGEMTTIGLDGDIFNAQHVNVGNPHAVIELSDRAQLDSLNLLEKPLYDPTVFPDGTNVECIFIDHDRIQMRVWERGVGETYSCGTGVVASACVAARKNDLSRVKVCVLGGELDVDWQGDESYLTGPADITARGQAYLQGE